MKTRILTILLLLLCLTLALVSCGETPAPETPDDEAHIHTEGDWIIDEDSTCGVDGSKHTVCTECGETVSTATIPATGDHTESDWIVDTEPVGSTNGSKYTECTVCGEKIRQEVIVAASSGLSFDINPDGTTCTITHIGTCTDTDIYVPESIDGYTVTSIGSYAFDHCYGLTSITIPGGVTSIGSSAFADCAGLTNITVAQGNTKYHSSGNCLIETATKTLISGCKSSVIPTDGSVTSIGEGAFFRCTGLTSITIPSSVTSIGEGAFSSCYKLVEVYDLSEHLTVTAGNSGNGSVGEYAKVVHTSVAEESCLHTTQDGYVFFENGDEVYLVDYVGTDTDLALPDKHHGKSYGIYQGAFYNCTSLASISIPSSVTSIGDGAFGWCTGLKSITIPEGVTSIGDDAFRDCTSLASVTFAGDSQLTSIGAVAFYGCTSLTRITIPSSVTSIGEDAFRDCTGLTSVTFAGDSWLTGIGSYAFSGCTSLTSIAIPTSVTSIGDDAFFNCKGLKTVTFAGDSRLTSIDSGAFSYCRNLTSITIPSSVTSIGKHAFEGCYKLVEVYDLSEHLTVTAGFDDNGSVGEYAKVVHTSVAEESYLHTTQDGYIFYENGDEVYLVGYVGTDTTLTLPDKYNGKTYKVYQYAFYYCAGLTSITIPSGVTSIGDGAFLGCTGLTSVTIPDSVTSIGGGAFDGCTGLTSLTIPDSVTSIGAFAFHGCTGLTHIYCEAASQPSGWSSIWKFGCSAQVVWSYTG